MEFLEEILELFTEESIDDSIQEASNEILDSPHSFFDLDYNLDMDTVSKVAEQHNIEISEAQNFLEVTQSIQHSLGEFADQELYSNIDNYIDNFSESPRSMVGLVSNIKGIYGEHEVYERIRDAFGEDVTAIRSMATNAKEVDFILFDQSGEELSKLQVKITENPDYILETREQLDPDIQIVTTNEAIENIIQLQGELPDGIVGVDITNAEITGQVERTINILRNTEPEFDILLNDPVLSEHLAQEYVEDPFASETLSRKMYADNQDRPGYNWTYSGFEIPEDFPSDYITYQVEWSPRAFDGIGTPIHDASFWSPQAGDNSCAVVTQKNILESLTGEQISEEGMCSIAIEKGVYDPIMGTPVEHMSTLLEEKGLNCVNEAGAEFSQIENALKEGKKVIVGLDASEITTPLRDLATGSPVEQPNMGHCVQITGIDYSDPLETKVIIADPGIPDGAMAVVSKQDFLNSWNDFGNRMTKVSK